MKRIFIQLLLITVISVSCGGASSGKDAKAADVAASGGTSGSGKGTISCVIDGTPVSITVQNAFFPITLNTDTKGPDDGFELMDGSAKKEGFQFEIKDHGITNIRGGADDIFCIITYFDKEGATFVGKDVTVTVSSSSNNHLTGTFSGKFEKSIGDKNISISDGKFDLTR
jgi:hypothetical protein